MLRKPTATARLNQTFCHESVVDDTLWPLLILLMYGGISFSIHSIHGLSVRLTGGNGYINDYPLGRILRNAKLIVWDWGRDIRDTKDCHQLGNKMFLDWNPCTFQCTGTEWHLIVCPVIVDSSTWKSWYCTAFNYMQYLLHCICTRMYAYCILSYIVCMYRWL